MICRDQSLTSKLTSFIESSLFTRCQDLCPMFAEVAVDGDAPRETKGLGRVSWVSASNFWDYLPLKYYRGVNMFAATWTFARS